MFFKQRPVGPASVLAVVTIFLSAASVRAAAPPFEMFGASDAVRVFEDGYGRPDKPLPEIRVFGLRNETISAQCVVQAHEDLKAMSVSIGPLKRREGSAVIPAEDIQWNFVKGIFIEKNTRKVRPSDLGRMDRIETGFVAHFGQGGWSSSEVLLSDFSVQDEATGQTRRMAGKEFLPQLLPALVKHLREKGWLEKTLFHIADEPSDHNVMPWREAADFVHRCAPELRRLDAIETTHCQGRLEVWIPKLDHLATWESAYEEARLQAIEAILDLDVSPRAIVQTNPLEHSAVANDCSIEVYGWAEPAAGIKVNGQTATVAADGLFMTLASPSRQGTIVVEAKSDKGRKTIVRKFRLLYSESR